MVSPAEARAIAWVSHNRAGGRVYPGDPTKGATAYERVGAGSLWAKNREFSVIIGDYAFYRIEPDE